MTSTIGAMRWEVKAHHGLASVQPLHAGVFTAVQRFRSDLGLYVHLHCLVTDGAFEQAGGGVRVVTPEGALLGTIMVPEGVTNCKLGEADGMTQFLTAPPNVYRIRLKVKGAGLP